MAIFNFSKKIIKISNKEIYNQIKNVLRMKVGDKVLLRDGQLNEAEVGIKEIVPIITRQTIKLNLNKERLNKIIKEAAE